MEDLLKCQISSLFKYHPNKQIVCELFLYCSVGTPAIPAATIEFASLCLRNASLLLSKVPEASAAEQPQSEDKEDG